MEQVLTEKRPALTSKKTYLIATIMIILWGSAYVGIRAAAPDYSPGAMALLRYLVASICMIFIYGRSLKFRKISKRDLFLTGLLGIFGFSIYNVALNYGEITVSASIASFVVCQIPVLITLVAVIFFQDHLTMKGWLGTALCFLGIILMAFGEGHGWKIDFGIIYLLIAAIAGTIFSVFQKPLLLRVHPIEFTAYAIWIGTLAMIIYLPDLIREIPKANPISTLAVIYNGIFPAAIAYLLWGYILANMPSTKAAAFLYLVPFATLIIAAILLKEIPTGLAFSGGVAALIGAVLVHRGVIHRRH